MRTFALSGYWPWAEIPAPKRYQGDPSSGYMMRMGILSFTLQRASLRPEIPISHFPMPAIREGVERNFPYCTIWFWAIPR